MQWTPLNKVVLSINVKHYNVYSQWTPLGRQFENSLTTWKATRDDLKVATKWSAAQRLLSLMSKKGEV